jgi:hypothetical protein
MLFLLNFMPYLLSPLLFLLELTIFVSIWGFVLTGIFITCRSVVARCSRFNGNRSLPDCVAVLCAGSVFFQLLKMYSTLRILRDASLARGPPLSCQNNLLGMLTFSDTCEAYLASVHGNPFWQLNPLSVIATLLADLSVTFGLIFGQFSGSLVGAFLKELPWIYQLPAFFIFVVSILTSVFLAFGYQFNIGYGLVQIRPSSPEVPNHAPSLFNASKPLPPLPKQ